MIIVITSPNDLPEEEEIANRLFENGLHALHLRKPGATRERYERFIRGIAPRFRERVVVHDYPELAEAYGLRGIHLRHGEIAKAEEWKDLSVSVSCHSFEEIRRLPFRPAYVFLSPVFDSISKEGYRAAFHPDELRRFLREEDIPVVALGGVTAENADQCREMGFAGVALLGHIWEHPGEAERRFKAIFPDTALSVAGFDPCAGDGITADTKTFEELGVYGLGAASAVTFQNQDEYLGTRWLPAEDISRQVETLARKFSPRFVKIGLIESFETLLHMAKILKREWPRTRIIWDPILKASAGQVFHETASRKTLEEILDFIYLLTPNAEEAKALFGDATDEALQAVCRRHGTNILRKGGHETGALSSDRLITPESLETFSVARAPVGKHGTGCALSAAIVSFLTLGYPLAEACRQGQWYVNRFIRSNAGKLGIHHQMETSRPDLYSIPLQYITDYREDMSVVEQAEAVCRGGCRWVQLRMKEASLEELLETGRKVKAVCRKHGALFIVNDNVEAALILDADGAHLGKEDMDPREARKLLGPSKIIGGTCNTLEDIEARCRQGVDYIGLGPFTYTSTKKKLSPFLGLEGYRRLMEACRERGIRLPVHAIGGITEKDIPSLLAAGVSGVALSSLLKNSGDMTTKTTEIINIIRHATIKNS